MRVSLFSCGWVLTVSMLAGHPLIQGRPLQALLGRSKLANIRVRLLNSSAPPPLSSMNKMLPNYLGLSGGVWIGCRPWNTQLIDPSALTRQKLRLYWHWWRRFVLTLHEFAIATSYALCDINQSGRGSCCP
ncbi:hypothetical protein F4861DRAFT_288139 [Xylaria intraflava]|nr:hypothetical protein F4861DRAFT_288139 [Xylaria intraflava]